MGVAILTFLLIFALTTLLVGVGLRVSEGQKKRKVTQMLVSGEGRTAVAEAKVLMEPSTPSRLATAISQLNIGKKMEANIQQAGLTWSVTALLTQSMVLAVVGGFIGLTFNLLLVRWVSTLAGACIFGALPYLYIMQQRSKRLKTFEQQFPEALDFLARAMRAGHAFSISLEMLSDESPPPLAVEFRKVFNEHNLGLPVETALKNLVERVPLLDVRFFVSAVLLQRETGGNLAEILTKLAHIIRERFQLKGQVRAASAHGRLTGTILTLMPVALALGLMIVAPSYLPSLAADPDGKYIIVAAVIGVLLGHFTIRRIIDIKV